MDSQKVLNSVPRPLPVECDLPRHRFMIGLSGTNSRQRWSRGTSCTASLERERRWSWWAMSWADRFVGGAFKYSISVFRLTIYRSVCFIPDKQNVQEYHETTGNRCDKTLHGRHDRETRR